MQVVLILLFLWVIPKPNWVFANKFSKIDSKITWMEKKIIINLRSCCQFLVKFFKSNQACFDWKLNFFLIIFFSQFQLEFLSKNYIHHNFFLFIIILIYSIVKFAPHRSNHFFIKLWTDSIAKKWKKFYIESQINRRKFIWHKNISSLLISGIKNWPYSKYIHRLSIPLIQLLLNNLRTYL